MLGVNMTCVVITEIYQHETLWGGGAGGLILDLITGKEYIARC